MSEAPLSRVGAPISIYDGRVEEVVGLLRSSGLPWQDLDDAPLEVLVARGADGSVVGCVGIGWYGSQALLRSLAVEPRSRKAGIGTALLSAAIDRARTGRAIELIGVTTTAEALLSRFGFERIERAEATGAVTTSSEFTFSCPEEASVMVLRNVLHG